MQQPLGRGDAPPSHPPLNPVQFALLNLTLRLQTAASRLDQSTAARKRRRFCIHQRRQGWACSMPHLSTFILRRMQIIQITKMTSTPY